MPAVSKACDACRIRRTKCNGEQPCLRCGTSNISCSYNLQRRKRGPRGKTVTMLQDVLGGSSSSPSSRAESSTSVVRSARPRRRSPLVDSVPLDFLGPTLEDIGFLPFETAVSPLLLNLPQITAPALASPNMADLFAQLQPVQRPFGQSFHTRAAMLDLLDGLLTTGVRDYFRYLHTLWPVVDATEVQARFAHKEHLHNEGFAAMILTMVALRLFVPGQESPNGTGNLSKAETLLREAVAMHNTPDLAMNPTLECISTTMLIASVLRVTRGFNAFYLRSREAIALTELLNLSDPEAYKHFSPAEKQVALNIFWLLAAVERSNALLRTRIGTPVPQFRPAITIRGSLTHLLKGVNVGPGLSTRLEPCTRLFETMDEPLIECINNICGDSCRLSVDRAMVAHNAVQAVHPAPDLSPVQLADLLITKLWLHVEVWRACMTHSLLESSVPELGVAYPVDILVDLVGTLNSLPFGAVTGNGRGMGNKLLSVVATAEAVLNLSPPPEFGRIASIDEGRALAKQVTAVAETLTSQQWIRWEP